MLIFVGFIFSGGIPFMLPLTLIGLATRFLVLKYIFVRFCRIPNYYTESMNERAKIILQLTLIIHLGVTIWMYGVNDIFGDFDRISVRYIYNGRYLGLEIIMNKMEIGYTRLGINLRRIGIWVFCWLLLGFCCFSMGLFLGLLWNYSIDRQMIKITMLKSRITMRK